MASQKTDSSKDFTPLMQQYLSIKKEQPDALLLFRMGDFYETFFEDAKTASKILGITLTTRDKKKKNPVPLAGFPYHALENFLKKLLDNGIKVAICEQVEDPKKAKKLVKRKIVEVITPGTILEENYLNDKSNNFLSAIYEGKQTCGIASIDISTGEFSCTELPFSKVVDELSRIHPTEILIPENMDEKFKEKIQVFYRPVFTVYETWPYEYLESLEILKNHFDVVSLEAFGVQNKSLAVSASAVILSYLKNLKGGDLAHVNSLRYYSSTQYMQVDALSRHNLELTESMRTRTKHGTLLEVMDETKTPMGSRKLIFWMLNPLMDKDSIIERLDGVDELLDKIHVRNGLIEILSDIGDVERIISKIGTNKAYPRDLIALKNYLQLAQPISELISQCEATLINEQFTSIQNFDEVILLIENALEEEAPATLQEGGIIKKGYNQELDELRKKSRKGKEWIAELQDKEIERTKIPKLKVKFNNVFGYYIEVTKSHLDKVPDDYIRKQTLVNAERFITPELKEFEDQVLGAEERSTQLEYELFVEIRDKMKMFIPRIQQFSQIVATLDVVSNLAQLAYYNHYIRPEITESNEIEIKEGRHPVIEQLMSGHEFIPNDTYMNNDSDRILLITGPNMAGKSTFLRQVGLLIIMAQMGSFVPAKSAKIGTVDKIFTRVGASDNLALGQSTFLVEMIETANILHNATPRSLVLLDEIGRGTSTFDGLSIAWAVVEYLHENSKIAAKTLFATHYHELTELANVYKGVKNYNITAKEYQDRIIFLRKVVPGSADQSYGIQVAKLAGIPKNVITRAQEILEELEKSEFNESSILEKTKRKKAEINQTSFIEVLSQKTSKERAIIRELMELDVNDLTPIDALTFLSKLKEKL
ncbi:MAG TPA: DNA mismatch repair protein MutS [Candidatus Cloacimonetes bacterium]|nr:DNA mismatch repair protein MutS [Candidatus Cloacimonadota bacterium]HEX38179.1 DNA mismatch repair protein MutS [Candidatus Cloacimonadota bacterium]